MEWGIPKEYPWMWPVSRMALLLIAFVSIMPIILWIPFYFGPGATEFVYYSILLEYIIGLVAIGLSYIYYRDVWHYIHRLFVGEDMAAVEAITRVLKEEREVFTSRDGKRSSIIRKRFVRVFHLETSGLEIAVEERTGMARVYLGPVKGHEEREIERLKGLVEKALG